jgi:BirA family transcriptional regulator, biotin operon repressor / biotin---[acetyl-CoA-carboxylase] ligase
MDQTRVLHALAGLPLGPVRYFDRLGSTNTEATAWADQGAPDPPDAALAFSLVLRPAEFLPAGDEAETLDLPVLLGRLTALAALAVCYALRDQFGLAPGIKWPNDVLLERRKVCGILAEAQWNGAELAAVILGVGLNVRVAAVPPASELIYPATSVETILAERSPELAGRADALYRPALLAGILRHLLNWRSRLAAPVFWQAWDDLLAFKGERVWVSPGPSSQSPAPGAQVETGYLAQVLGLDPSGCLRVQPGTGEALLLHTGELHIRPQDWEKP